jgi:hypothetical protein
MDILVTPARSTVKPAVGGIIRKRFHTRVGCVGVEPEDLCR